MENKDFKLTSHVSLSKKCKDGKYRNFIYYFINDVKILKQKVPFDIRYEHGFDEKIHIYDAYVFNGRIYQTRSFCAGCGCGIKNTRQVSFPLSKRILNQLNVPFNLKIEE